MRKFKRTRPREGSEDGIPRLIRGRRADESSVDHKAANCSANPFSSAKSIRMGFILRLNLSNSRST